MIPTRENEAERRAAYRRTANALALLAQAIEDGQSEDLTRDCEATDSSLNWGIVSVMDNLLDQASLYDAEAIRRFYVPLRMLADERAIRRAEAKAEDGEDDAPEDDAPEAKTPPVRLSAPTIKLLHETKREDDAPPID